MSATLKSLEAIKSKMNDQQQEFEQVLKEFELQKQKFEEEKQQVDQYFAQNDVLHLNVGGEHFCTSRSTLTLIKGTIFDNIFSADKKLLLDRDNRVFLDYDPELFKLLLNQLRQLIDVNDDDRLFEIPKGSSHDRQRFRHFLRQLKFDEKYFDLQFYDNAHELAGKTVKARYSPNYENRNIEYSYFYGSHMYSTGCHRVQIKILDVNVSHDQQSYYCLSFGIATFAENKKQLQSSCINWVFRTHLPSGKDMLTEIQSGDIIELEINCNERLIAGTNQRTMIERHIMLNDSDSITNRSFPWRFYVQLKNNETTSIRII